MSRPAVFIHVGAPKSGTTFLQEKLFYNRDALRANGFLYPGEHWVDHVQATFDLRKIDFKGHEDPAVEGAWGRLIAEIREWGGPAIIDQELLSGTFPDQIARAMDDLSFADVHIVYTLRDMSRTLPAAWQEWIKNRETDDFDEWLRAVQQPAGKRERPGWLFWNLHDAEFVLTKWSAGLPPDRVHVITVPLPGADRSLLWRRFADVLGIDPDAYPDAASSANTSLAAPEAAALRRLNIAIGGEGFPWPVYDRLVKYHLAVDLGRRSGPRIALPSTDFEWAVQWCKRTAEFISSAGFDVRGELAELVPDRMPEGVDPQDVDPAAVADAAIAGMASLVHWLTTGGDGDERARIAELETRLDQAQRALREHRLLPPGERVKRLFVELSDQTGLVGRPYGWYRRLARRGGRGHSARS